MTKRQRTFERPLTLDMDFGEALARFAQTDPKEVSFRLGLDKVAKERAGMDELSWNKELSTTDAQQPTTGGIVPYLRLTKSSLTSQDFQTWFRQAFFGPAAWALGNVGRETGVEVTSVVMAVTVGGLSLGSHPVMISHGPNRMDRNNTPNTWLHWPPVLQSVLEANDMTGHTITLTRRSKGQYELEIV